VVALLAALPLEERRKVPGLQPERADIILAGAAILDAFMQELGVLEIHVSERGLREGLLVDYLLKHQDASLLAGLSVRARSVLQLGAPAILTSTCPDHSSAPRVVDSARAGVHRLGTWGVSCWNTALLHHIGAFLTYTDYQARLYLSAMPICWALTDRNCLMATTALYQRKPSPARGMRLCCSQYAGHRAGLECLPTPGQTS
jgi:exopolyphosphatase/guanosine-5'-triphosphate,3'-diphosphate pyrophosphatase